MSKRDQPKPEAPAELWRQADILLGFRKWTREDALARYQFEPVRPRRAGKSVEVRARPGLGLEGDELIEVLSIEDYHEIINEALG